MSTLLTIAILQAARASERGYFKSRVVTSLFSRVFCKTSSGSVGYATQGMREDGVKPGALAFVCIAVG